MKRSQFLRDVALCSRDSPSARGTVVDAVVAENVLTSDRGYLWFKRDQSDDYNGWRW